MKGIELILTLNYFVFDDKWYLQIKGVAMGTKLQSSSQYQPSDIWR